MEITKQITKQNPRRMDWSPYVLIDAKICWGYHLAPAIAKPKLDAEATLSDIWGSSQWQSLISCQSCCVLAGFRKRSRGTFSRRPWKPLLGDSASVRASGFDCGNVMWYDMLGTWEWVRISTLKMDCWWLLNINLLTLYIGAPNLTQIQCFRIPLQKCQASLNILYTLINTLEIHWAILSL